MNITTIFATIHCRSFAESTGWYVRLFDRDPDAEPMPTLKEWHLGGTAGLQLVEDHDRAGKGGATLGVTGIEAFAKRMKSAGLPVGEISQGDFARILTLADPDGNQIVLAETDKDQK